MIKVDKLQKLPIKMWLEDIEDGAMEQARDLASLPFAFKHIAIMPDSHQGYGMPIGAVLATDSDVIVPNAVGVDIGCGMCAVQTDLLELADVKGVIEAIKDAVPVGFKGHATAQSAEFMPEGDVPYLDAEYEGLALQQLGTLGGGNHFIELQKGSDGHIWIMIHSGSRGIGHKTASYYHKQAVDLNERFHSFVPKDLAHLPLDSIVGMDYQNDMEWCVEYALANRKHMMSAVLCILGCEPLQCINKPHNYAEIEHHFGRNVMVHRKGACRARKGELGMIPASQGVPSYIVRGLGEEQSFHSCSHGAGRRMGRKQAIRELVLADEVASMGDIVHSLSDDRALDEAPSAYKDMNVVMENQKDLVEIVVELTPLGVVKG